MKNFFKSYPLVFVLYIIQIVAFFIAASILAYIPDAEKYKYIFVSVAMFSFLVVSCIEILDSKK